MTQERRARRTRAEVEAAITAAVLDELRDVGFRAMTFEGVARRAEVSKAVLYRRHADLVSLTLAALEHTAADLYTDRPSSGSLRDDLLAWLTVAEEQATRLGEDTFRGIVGAATPAQLARLTDLMTQRVHDVDRCIIEPARRRGEIRGEPPQAVTRLVFTLARDQAIFVPRDHRDPQGLVDDVLLPLLAGAHQS